MFSPSKTHTRSLNSHPNLRTRGSVSVTIDSNIGRNTTVIASFASLSWSSSLLKVFPRKSSSICFSFSSFSDAFEVSFELLRRSTAASVAQEDVLRSFAISLISTLSLSAFYRVSRKRERTENDAFYEKSERQRRTPLLLCLLCLVFFFFPQERERERATCAGKLRQTVPEHVLHRKMTKEEPAGAKEIATLKRIRMILRIKRNTEADGRGGRNVRILRVHERRVV